MAYLFEYDSSHRIFLVRFEGQVTDQEFEEYYRVAGEHITRLRPAATISDFSEVRDLQVSAQTVRDLARSYIAMPGSNPRVVVAPAKHIYGLARMFQIEGEPTRTNLHVVSTLPDAYAILELRDAHFERIQIIDDGS